MLQYNENYYKVIQFKRPVRKKGFESDEPLITKSKSNSTYKSDDIIQQSISRAKKTIFDYALCNDFDYFVTLTFDRKKVDSSDLVLLKKRVGQWLNNYKKRVNPSLKYLIIPELHSDKKHFHFHGLISDISSIKEYKKSKKGVMRYNWLDWHDKFGFTSLEAIKNKNAVSKYITKYVTKEIITTFNKQRYLVSKGLKKP